MKCELLDIETMREPSQSILKSLGIHLVPLNVDPRSLVEEPVEGLEVNISVD